MEDLPTPLSRVELYLATAAQMPGVTPPEEPLSRLEQYLAFIAGDTSVELPAPASLCEQWLAYVAGITPAEPLKLEGAFHVGVQKVDVRFFAVAAGMPGVVAPEPQNRTEQYWARLAEILPVHGVLKYATGTNITLTDVAWWKMGLERINGDTTQQTYSGKNLMPVQAGTASNYGLTVTVTDDGKITINGTTTTGVLVKVTNGVGISVGDQIDASWFQQSIVSDLNGDTISIRYVSGTYQDSGVAWRIFKDTAPYLYQWYPNNSILQQSFTSSTVATTFFALYAQTGKTFNNYTVQVQLETGDTATDFEPYVGGVPAPNPDYPQDVNVATGPQRINMYGINLFDKDLAPEGVYIDANGKWTISGSSPTYINQEIETVGGESFTISFSKRVGSAYVRFAEYDENAVFIKRTLVSTGSPTTITISANCASVIWSVDGAENIHFENLQIERGSTSTSYEPCEWQRYLVGLYGKNMFNKDDTTNRLTSLFISGTSGTGSLESSANARCVYVPIEGGKTYTVSKVATTYDYFKIGTTTTHPRWKVVVNDIKSVPGSSTSATLTASPGSKYLVIWWGRVDFLPSEETVLASIQVEEGKTATVYEAYTPIELCKIGTYQDYIYKSGNDWYMHKEIRHLSLPVVNMDNTNNNFPGWKNIQEITLDFPPGYNQNINYATSSIDNIEGLNPMNSGKVIWGANANSNVLYANRGFFGSSWTQTYWKANYSDLIVELYYGIVNPITDTQITNQSLISQLNALDRAILPQPVAYITASGDLPGELQISYYGEEE